MELLNRFSHLFIHYVHELWWSLLLGFVLSGIIHAFIPQNFVERFLGKKGFRSLLLTSLIGTALPVCCMGALPISITLRRKGASLGAVFAFLVTTPATSISALLVCWKLLGGLFTIAIFFGAISLGLITGFIFDAIKFPIKNPANSNLLNAHTKGDESNLINNQLTFMSKLKQSFDYAFIKLPREIGLEIIIGILVASFIVAYEPIQQLMQKYLSGVVAYLFVLVLGMFTYTCSTASVPLADAFIQSGMGAGPAFTFLLSGPITSYGTVLVLKKEYGMKVLVIYFSIICVFSLIYGIIFDLIS